MDNFQKYSRLMLLIVGGFISLILFIALLVFILRLFSITLFYIPGFDLFFELIIVMIPYLVFFAAYYYLFKKINHSSIKATRIVARGLVFAGIVFCTFTLILSIMLYKKMNNDWLRIFEQNSHYGLIFQLILLLLTAGIIAGGDTKEKDWMERRV